MLETLVIYGFVLFSLLSFAMVSSKRYSIAKSLGKERYIPCWTWEMIFSVLLFSMVFGFRNNVGIDFSNYVNDIQTGEYERYEYIVRGLINALLATGIPIWVFFWICACLQISLLLFSFRRERYLLPFVIFVLICGQYFLLWMNVIRQDIATCIFICTIPLIRDKKFWPFLLCIVIACGFHKTSIGLIIFYFLFQLKKDYTKHVWLEEAILFLSAFFFITNKNLLGNVDELLAPLLISIGMEGYAFGAIQNSTTVNVLGFTFLAEFSVDFLIVAFSEKMKRFYKSDKFVICYNLYFLGAILGLLLGFSYILLRPVRYLRFFKLVVAPYFLYYLWKTSGKTMHFMWLLVAVALYLLLFAAIFRYGPEACYQFKFIFQ